MNSQLDLYKIAEALVVLMEQFGIAIDGASVDLVPYLKTLGDKIVAYKESIAWLWIWVAVALTILVVILFIIGMIKDWDGFQYGVLVVGLLLVAVIVVLNMYTIIACNTFPEKVILDFIESTINSNTTAR